MPTTMRWPQVSSTSRRRRWSLSAAVPSTARAAKVHDVDQTGACRGPGTCQCDGVAARLGDPVVVAAQQTHGPAAQHVDGGDDDHVAAASPQRTAKLRSTCAPTLLLFTGWNCVPQTLARARAETKRPPYSVVATAASSSPRSSST